MLVLIRKARVVDTRSEFNDKIVDLLIDNGTIKTIASTIDAKADTIIEAEGLHVSPGWADIFADYCEPGYEHKETIASGLQAAAQGGFTDVMLTPNTNPTLSNKSTIEYVLQKAKDHTVALHPLGTITQHAQGKDLAEMLDMQAHGAIAFTDGWQPVQNAGLMLKALEYVKAFNGTVIQIPTDSSLALGGLMNEGPASTRLGIQGIPDLAETLMVHRDIELLRYTNSRLHITGISSAASVAMIRKAKAEGLKLSCSVTPYHLALTDEVMSSYDSLYKVNPPLRSEADRQALIAGLKDGTIDCITSHHRPQEWDAKAKELEYAADGINLQEMAFNVAWTALKNEVPLNRIIDALSIAPRKIFGLPDAVIKEKNKVNLTIFTTGGGKIVNENQIKSKSKNNPFIGKEINGHVTGIINNMHTHLNK